MLYKAADQSFLWLCFSFLNLISNMQMKFNTEAPAAPPNYPYNQISLSIKAAVIL